MAIRRFDAVHAPGDMLRFEALPTMSAAARHVARDYPVVPEALWRAAPEQLRDMATIGAAWW